MSLPEDEDVIRHSRRIEPISRSTWPFCQGNRGAVGLSRMPMARSEAVEVAGVVRPQHNVSTNQAAGQRLCSIEGDR